MRHTYHMLRSPSEFAGMHCATTQPHPSVKNFKSMSLENSYLSNSEWSSFRLAS